MRSLRVDERARREAKEAAEWYAERGAGLSGLFTDELLAAISFAHSHPLQCSPYLHGTRRAFLKKFPYFVVLLEFKDTVYIVAVAHAKRREGFWMGRVTEKQ